MSSPRLPWSHILGKNNIKDEASHYFSKMRLEYIFEFHLK